ncbi:hypothetical protein JB92DRAFT_3127488 [Gautieria morchelliformis]|nr:hypothetical protein JB92DRAFT_3127488 [Gautieria morchelliformis]
MKNRPGRQRQAATRSAKRRLTARLFDEGGALDSQTTDSQFISGALGVHTPNTSAKEGAVNRTPLKMEATTPQLPRSPVTPPPLSPSGPPNVPCLRPPTIRTWTPPLEFSHPARPMRIRDLESQVHQAQVQNHRLCSIIQELELTLARLKGDRCLAIHEAGWLIRQDAIQDWLRENIKKMWVQQLGCDTQYVGWVDASGRRASSAQEDLRAQQYFVDRVYEIVMHTPRVV